ncbi:alpha-(1,3)-fucosyltransferase [Proboscivirus elephantidbeta5]|uniref:4-galactosyl-N-acetylglucosaminide 3-alpha-L-fucosyltransferase 9 n=1 Tax=Elephant endotheliotropic herpesvirus 5 TaxID=768738 RepID=A0A075CYM6_9BETA|nr:alpha-(1,3)-fucosyltransferase [Elephant endotheliotropic herpesvirus 5]AHC02812.1 alpha-(1,3)-fucosyltransferase [Elephant endotheliotropic herpesvirus 5]
MTSMSSETLRLLLLFCVTQSYIIICLLLYISTDRNEPALSGVGPITSSTPLSKPTEECPTETVLQDTVEKETLILLWTWPYGHPFDLNACSSRFNIRACHVTVDRSVYYKANAVVFHHREISIDPYTLPTEPRPTFQKWIWMNLESPSNSPFKQGIENLFNLTLTYRRDSDIHVPYGSLTLRDTALVSNPVPAKSKLVCWVVSNWNNDHVRSRYYLELSKHIDIHVYGNVVGDYIPDDDFIPLLSSCKFYLAFENSVHRDYITEKLYRSLMAGAVPIVLGTSRENYENYVPGDAFIHVNDYTSPIELASHLNAIDKNVTLYLQYFNWKTRLQVSIVNIWEASVCHACNYMKKSHAFRAVPDLKKWFWI